jgi:hypothetical protein
MDLQKAAMNVGTVAAGVFVAGLAMNFLSDVGVVQTAKSGFHQ